MQKVEGLNYVCTAGSEQSLKTSQIKWHLNQGLKNELEYAFGEREMNMGNQEERTSWRYARSYKNLDCV